MNTQANTHPPPCQLEHEHKAGEDFCNSTNNLYSLRRCVAVEEWLFGLAFWFQQIFTRDQRLKKWTANSCTNLKLEQWYSCCLQMRLQIKNWEGLSVTFKHESRDYTNMFVFTMFAQITRQIYLTDTQFNKSSASDWSCEAGHVSLIASKLRWSK